AVDFLQKPIDPGSLLTKAATFFELARQREELRESEIQLREANEQLAERNRALAEADRNKDKFLAVLAHELRNPLAPILLGLEMTQAIDDCPEAVRDLTGMMRRQMGQMVHLIDDLLDVSRINTGKIVLKRERMELAPVLEAAVEAARPMIEARKHLLEFAPVPQGLVLEADRHRLAQIVSNLLSNAAKYTPPGGRIGLAVKVQGGEIARIEVSDDGEGISAEDQVRIFGMFEQIDPKRQDGLGIGLTLVKNLVELHGGTISVTSAGPGRGSVFAVTLPLAEQPVAAAARSGNDGLPEAGGVVQDRPARVMVADDGKSTADVLGMFLEMEGIEARVVYDGEEAVRTEEDFRPQMVFMDLGMPKMNGYEAAGKIRESGREVVLVALSGWGREEDRRRTAEAGFDAHLVKPVAPDDLRRMLGRYAELRQRAAGV
ncbi:MAG: hybrid sensor histidine kinase/response regulator, partial [Akkermansiaceae bacterium]|nr:hybrid sensor histidine kinase/response regulator [Akkermansiaceae bacterium]